MRDRGVSVVVSYVMVLGIVTLLMSGLFISMSGFVETQRERAIRSELQSIGNEIATDLTVIGRLAHTTTDAGTITVSPRLPERVAGTPYTITITQRDDRQYELTLRSLDPEVVVTIHVRSPIPIQSVTINGGTLELRYDTQTDDPVVVTHA